METRNLVVFDGHNDALLQLHDPKRGRGRTFFVRSEHGHLDLPRAREGGFAGGMFAVFVPAPSSPSPGPLVTSHEGLRPAIEHDYASEIAGAMLNTLERIEADSQGQVRICRTFQEVLNCLRTGILAAVIHFEGAEQIRPDLSDLRAWYARGLRSLGLVWARPNAFGHGVPLNTLGSPDIGPGLTDAGRLLVRACNEMRILIDLSHLNERGFWDVAELSQSPLVVTHSGACAAALSARNLTDQQLDAVRDSNGIVGLSLNTSDLLVGGANGPDVPIEVLVRHIDHMVQRMGIDHVGMGCDFDGCTVPCAIGDVTGLPKLFAALSAAGYDAGALQKIACENWLHVLDETWQAA
jgi:membrane dipeptidase